MDWPGSQRDENQKNHSAWNSDPCPSALQQDNQTSQVFQMGYNYPAVLAVSISRGDIGPSLIFIVNKVLVK